MINKYKDSEYYDAFIQAIALSKKDIETICSNPEPPTFDNTIAALDGSGRMLNELSLLFFNLNSACTSKTIQATAQKISPLLSQHSTEISTNKVLFARIKQIYKGNTNNLTTEQKTLLEDTWKSFVRGGANLEGQQLEQFKTINSELSQLCLQFEENLLEDTNAFQMHISDVAQLSGLPQSALDAAAATSAEQKTDGWTFTLHAPLYVPFMTYADNRELREKMYKAYSSRCNHNDKHDNKTIISKIVSLRLEKAKLLGYNTYAEYVLSNRMAETPSKVNSFLTELFNAAMPLARKEKSEVEKLAKKDGLTGELQRWDWAYYSNKLKQQKFKLDDEMLRPYFKLENVTKAVFGLATTLYGITFKEENNLPKYHKDVRTFEVYDNDGTFLAILMTDFFPRSNKSGGAWMTEYMEQHFENGKDIRPIVSIVMNFTKPTNKKPALLTFDEVTTLLHEFGHSLHGMFSRVHYSSVSGTNVYRDFVELPSQIMENWALEEEWLQSWAIHYETGEPIPHSLIKSIKDSANFNSGYQCVRQLSFGMVDMAWHSIDKKFDGSVCAFENEAMQKTELFPTVSGSCFCTGFGHIFDGGYAAGYYGYKWAEVLDADAFELFKENGILNRNVAESFRRNILEKGGSDNPMTLYVKFRGKQPSIEALLKRSGLK